MLHCSMSKTQQPALSLTPAALSVYHNFQWLPTRWTSSNITPTLTVLFTKLVTACAHILSCRHLHSTGRGYYKLPHAHQKFNKNKHCLLPWRHSHETIYLNNYINYKLYVSEQLQFFSSLSCIHLDIFLLFCAAGQLRCKWHKNIQKYNNLSICICICVTDSDYTHNKNFMYCWH